MGKHDEIVKTLNKKKLCIILRYYFGKKESWSEHHSLISKKVDEITMGEINGLRNSLLGIGFILESLNKIRLDEMIEFCKKHNKYINELEEENSLEINKKIEFPIIKGEGQYKTTKGYIDLVVHAKPVKKGLFSSYQDEAPLEFLIEIKKEEDLKDVGGIIRQINEYREYYNFNPYCSDIIGEDSNRNQKWILLIDKFDESYREMFEDEDVDIIDLSSMEEKNETKD